MSDKTPSKPGRNTYDFINVDKVFARMDLKPGENFLDIGCGRGGYTLDAAQRVSSSGQVVAVDKWANGINEIKQRAAQQNQMNIRTECLDVSKQLPVLEQSVDVCLMSMVIHHLVAANTIGAVINNISPTLKPKARMFVIEFEKIDGPPGPPKRIRLSPEQVQQQFPAETFELVDKTQIEPHIYMQYYEFRGLGKH